MIFFYDFVLNVDEETFFSKETPFSKKVKFSECLFPQKNGHVIEITF